MSAGLRRVLAAAAVLLIIIGSGGLAFLLLGRGVWSASESLYYAIITVSTVGFGEPHDADRIQGARVLSALLILLGSVALVYFQSNLTAMLVESHLGQAFRRKRMHNQIQALRGHILVAGVGSTGKHVVEELVAIGRPFVAIDTSLEKLDALNQEVAGGKLLFLHGDATHDQTLVSAGIAQAAGVVAALPSDRENLYVTLSARSLNPSVRIVAKVVEAEAARKMMIAGANATVSPNIIGGQRMVSEMVRPEVVQFLEQMMRDKDKNLRLEELAIPQGSSYAGLRLRQAPFRSAANVLVVAVRDAAGQFIYNPGSEFELEAGSVLIVLGETQGINQLRELLRTSVRQGWG